MEILQILEKNIYIFFFIFYRTLLLFFLFPIFGVAFFPTQLKILVSLVLAFILTPVISFKLPPLNNKC